MMGTMLILMAAGLLLGASVEAAPSPRQAFFRSLLVPGWGQRYGGGGTAAAWFAGTELTLWGGYAGARWLAGVREDRYRSYAAVHAGARTSGKSGSFFDDMGFYASVQEHNEYAAYREGPHPGLYPNTPEFFWEWDSEASRRQYRHLHNEHGSMDRDALYLAGLIAFNHVAAAIHAARTVRVPGGSDGAGRPAPPALRTTYDPGRGQARIVWVRRF